MGLFLSSGYFRFAVSFLFGAGKAVFGPVACDQVPGGGGRGQGTDTLGEVGGGRPDARVELRRRTTLVRGISPRGARHWGAALRDQTSHEGSWCQASMGPALLVL